MKCTSGEQIEGTNPGVCLRSLPEHLTRRPPLWGKALGSCWSPLSARCSRGSAGSRKAGGRLSLPIFRFPTTCCSDFARMGKQGASGSILRNVGLCRVTSPCPSPGGNLCDRHSHGGLGGVFGRRGALGHHECGLCPFLPCLWCLMSLELLQACVRGSPSAPLLRQKSGRALPKEQSSRKIFIDRKGIWSPPTLWQDNSEFPEDTGLAAMGPNSSQRAPRPSSDGKCHGFVMSFNFFHLGIC